MNSTTRSQLLFLFRGFLPSWKFFEESGEIPELWIRQGLITEQNETWQAWTPCLRKLKRSPLIFLWNPHGNLRHAEDTLLQHLVDLINDPRAHENQIENSVPFQLILNLVRSQIREDSLSHFQFKVVGILPGHTTQKMDDLLVSPIYRK